MKHKNIKPPTGRHKTASRQLAMLATIVATIMTILACSKYEQPLLPDIQAPIAEARKSFEDKRKQTYPIDTTILDYRQKVK